MLPTLVSRTFSDPGWIYEPKWDGWRALCFVRDGQERFLSRKKNSLNERFPELRDIAKSIKATRAILDGEIVALDERGMPSFDRLQFRKGRPCSIIYFAFDLVHLDGFDLTNAHSSLVKLFSKKFCQDRILAACVSPIIFLLRVNPSLKNLRPLTLKAWS